jgi:methoxymalonate biosynthesis acyl carrier protein
MNDTKVKIKRFLSAFFPTAALREDDDIFALGFVNSLFALQLITWVEKEFGIQIKDEDLDMENFNTIEAIASLVSRKSSYAMALK